MYKVQLVVIPPQSYVTYTKELKYQKETFNLHKNIHFYIISSEFRQNGHILIKYFNYAQISISHLASFTLKRLGEQKATGNKQNCVTDVSH